MNTFITQNGLKSNNNSVITGSLNITGTINGPLYITSSYVNTASYVINTLTASYTNINIINSSSYSQTSISSSYTYTASVAVNPQYGPTPEIGYISPNIYAGKTSIFGVAGAGTFGGVLMSPVLINRNCTLTTMSIAGGSNSGTTTAICAIYSNNSTTNLPEYLLTTGSLTTSNVTACETIHSTAFAPINLIANRIYWVAFRGTANYKWAYYASNGYGTSVNPLLGPRISTVAGSTIYQPINCIRSGSLSYTLTFSATASQSTGSYLLTNVTNPPILPVLKVTY